MKNKKSYSFRDLINDIHLWLGIGSGLIIFIICLSGTLLVFDTEIKALFADDIALQNTDQPVKSLNEIRASIEERGLGELSSITVDEKAGSFYEARIKTSPEDRRGTTFLVNPHTAEVFETPESSADGFMSSMFRLHRWLLLDTEIGRPIVGVATIIFILLSISGLILWFPKKLKWRNLKQGFKVKTDANWKRVNHDLHNTLGFYSLILIIVMGLTGLCWSFESYREVAGNVIGAQIFNRGGGASYEDPALPAEQEINIEEVYQIANEELSYEGKTMINLPSGQNHVYSIRKYDDSSFSPVIADQLVIDKSGSVREKEIFRDKPLNVQVASLIKPLHVGDIFGTFSKIIYFIVCLIATSLPVTGTIIWINKLRKKNKKAKKQKKFSKAAA